MTNEQRRLGLRIPAELHRELEEAADDRGVPMQWLAVRLLQEGIAALVPADELRLTKD